MERDTMERPDWLPEGWDFIRNWGACYFCGEPEGTSGAANRDKTEACHWCPECENRAKAAICGGET